MGKANKIILNNETLIDLTGDTVKPDVVKRGETFHGSDGETYTGTYAPRLQYLGVNSNGEYKPDPGYDGIGEVSVSVQPKTQNGTFTENGTFYPESGFDGFSSVTVNVPSEEPTMYDGSVTITGGADSGADLISFTFKGESYQAERGMTWYEWVNSDYNTYSGNLYVMALDSPNPNRWISVDNEYYSPSVVGTGEYQCVLDSAEIIEGQAYIVTEFK